MRALAPDEKLVMVMVYTANMLARGEVIARESARVSIWLRTQGVPNFIHLHKPQVISFFGGAPKNYTYTEMFIPTVQVAAFHLAPPAQDPMDYDVSEANRAMAPLDVMLGSFLMRGQIRISTQTDVATSLDVMRSAWLSIYEVDVTNSLMPQFSVHAPMMVVSPSFASFGVV